MFNTIDGLSRRNRDKGGLIEKMRITKKRRKLLAGIWEARRPIEERRRKIAAVRENGRKKKCWARQDIEAG